MNLNRIFVCLGIAGILALHAQGQILDGSPRQGAQDARKQYMEVSGIVLDICVYEREFQPPEKQDQKGVPFTEGTLISRAVVTGVHKGNVKVGTKIEIVEIVTNPPQYLTKFRSVVEGELWTYFYFGEKLPEKKNGRHVVDHNQMHFIRDMNDDVKSFLKKLHAAQKARN